jgi:hypothetical protein
VGSIEKFDKNEIKWGKKQTEVRKSEKQNVDKKEITLYREKMRMKRTEANRGKKRKPEETEFP